MAALSDDVDIDSTDNCPVGAVCEVCAGKLGDLVAVTIETPVGVLCATQCDPCIEAGRAMRQPGWTAAIERVFAHCEHLGIDVDTMAALIEAEGVNDRDPLAAGDGHPLFGGAQ